MAHILMVEVSDMAMPGLITGELTPDVTAGIPALGRSSDVQNLLLAGQELGAIIPVMQLDKRVNPQKVVDLVLAGRSIDTETLFFTPEEQKANQEAENATAQAQASMLEAGTLSDNADTITQTLGG